MKAAIYCRVSTDDQQKEGTSLQSQKDGCLKKAFELGYEVPDEFIVLETFSGLALDRPKLSELRQWVKDKEVDIVIAYTLDRLTRDPGHFIILQEEINRAGVVLDLVTETIESSDLGKLVVYIKGFAAKLEAEKIRERTTRGRKSRAQMGKLPTGGVNLYGYDYDSTTGKRKVNDYQASVVAMMFRWLIEEQCSCNEICRRLVVRGIPAPKGGVRWGRTTVGRILRNPVYCGETYSYIMRAVGSRREPRPREEWIELPDATPPIITKETFQAAQRQLKMNVGLASRDQKYQWLLRGLVFCRHCERRYCGEPEHKRYRYYRCPGRSRVVSPEPCRNYRVNADWLETIVWNRVKETLQNPDLLLHELKRRREAKTEVKYIEEELQRNQSRLGNLDEAETRAIRLRLYAGRSEGKTLAELQRIYDQRVRIEQAIDELEMQMETAKQAEINENGIKRFCEMAAQNIDDFGFVQKRLAMQALQVKIWIDRLTVIIEGLIPIGNFDKVTQQL